MNYSLITISGSCNDGNRIIEYALNVLINLPSPTITVSMFHGLTDENIERINQTDFCLLPGSTILAKNPGDSLAMEALPKIKVPKLCIGASVWSPRYPHYTEVFKHITPPIGCRDPFTLKLVKDAGIECILTGCPTTYVPKKLDLTQPDYPYSIIGFARENFGWQGRLFRRLTGKFMIAIQEQGHESGFARNLGHPSFTYRNPEDVYRRYARCQAVYTGRLHGVLPAMSQGKPVFFFGSPKDSRFTLLEHLGIRVNKMVEENEITLIHEHEYREQVDELAQNFNKWVTRVGIL